MASLERRERKPRLHWSTKAVTHRAKDAPDLAFPRQGFESRGQTPPEGQAR